MDVLEKTKELMAKAEEDKRKKEEFQKMVEESKQARAKRLREVMVDTFKQFDGFEGVNFSECNGKVQLERNGLKIASGEVMEARLYTYYAGDEYYGQGIVWQFYNKQATLNWPYLAPLPDQDKYTQYTRQ